MTGKRDWLVGRGIAVLLGVMVFSFMGAACTPQVSAMKQAAPSPTVLKTEGTVYLERAAGPEVGPVYQARVVAPHPGRALTDFTTANFVGSSQCGACHDLLVDANGQDMSIMNHWRSTMMANGARDPLWQAKVASEVARNPALQAVIEAKCVTCHMPMARTQAAAQGKSLAMLGSGFLAPDAELHQAAMDGVSCSFCHQIQDEKLGGKESFSGKFKVEMTAEAPAREIFGPYQDTVKKPMQTSVRYTPVYGAQVNDSALCATCHTLFTPFVDGAGKVAGEFPEQTPYLEWRHSDYGVNADRRYDIGKNPGQGLSCQECHMPHSEAGKVKIANWAPRETEAKDHFSQHHFVGGNVFMLNILQDNVANLNLTAATAKLEDTKKRTLDQLSAKTAGLAIQKLARSGPELTAQIRVENRTGHKFPTGIPLRGAWLHLKVTDKVGAVVFESGRPQSDGTIVGNSNDENGKVFEPHYDLITSPDQVQVYESIMQDTDDQVTYTLLRAAKYVKDNRLLPHGFDKATASADIGVYGEAGGDPDFTGGSDLVTYKVKVGGHAGPFTVRAVMYYRAVPPAFIADLRADDGLSLVKSFIGMYNQADRNPVPVAMVAAQVR